MIVDPVVLAQKLIRCQSITPLEDGCFEQLVPALEQLCFSTKRLPFPPVDNLYCRYGTQGPNFCFAGHIDVVPIRQEDVWIAPPFEAAIIDEILYGRGAVDMKGAIAAFIAAASRYLKNHSCPGSISLLLTSDEEGPATNGTVMVLEHLKALHESLSVCLVGEPTGIQAVGDILMVGRRGSLNVDIEMTGVSGHTAYPQLSKNPVSLLLTYLERLRQEPLDAGCENFERSNLEIISIDVDNSTYNMIPAKAFARLNIRFNPLHSSQTLVTWLNEKASGLPVSLKIAGASESFYTPDQTFIECVQSAARKITGITPHPSTAGGTSDARFIKNYCPVLELGLMQTTLHQANECVPLTDLEILTRIYEQILIDFFQSH